MSDFRNQSVETEKSEADASSQDEAGSSSSAPKQESGGRTSFWSRAARLWRMTGASSLRKDLADALMTEESGGEPTFLPEERAMLHNILRFREVRVEDVMVPRADIEAVDQDITIAELMVIFEDSGRSRMPVYNESLDDPRGMVHIRDLLAYVTKQARNKRRTGAKPAPANGEKPTRTPKAEFDLGRVDLSKTVAEAGIIRQVLFVPPSMLAADLMARMQADRTQMALVIDEYGGTDGLASLEDIVEMVVGDIEDEHDDEEAMIQRVSDDVFIADARVELEELAEAIGPDFDIREQLEDADTLGGLIFASLGRIPVRGEVVQAVPGFEFHVLDADPRRVKRVRVTRKRAGSVRRRERKPEGEGLPLAGDRPKLPEQQNDGANAE
ncbi:MULTISPECIES: hemolysin family protein [unclassified Shinella]|uniref:hemolysin family protein n=1 Tax=unclassified Shinella TaxID=2643062 RepID=UPI00225D4228|nr:MULTISPECIES: hemolysin family protein [unclassified Shinella]MCO5137171.1 hemolysin family protein [Shinella sp.]MDC7253151.1 hemolysin family protein [Shinella sp. YE25]CAI0340561.1 Magnesium and cobalt efflux protein CorC [Rhizobiaceae bacterium]CAK7258925.1 CBS domain protein [Shinella sp. WSC3-e]